MLIPLSWSLIPWTPIPADAVADGERDEGGDGICWWPMDGDEVQARPVAVWMRSSIGMVMLVVHT